LRDARAWEAGPHSPREGGGRLRTPHNAGKGILEKSLLVGAAYQTPGGDGPSNRVTGGEWSWGTPEGIAGIDHLRKQIRDGRWPGSSLARRLRSEVRSTTPHPLVGGGVGSSLPLLTLCLKDHRKTTSRADDRKASSLGGGGANTFSPGGMGNGELIFFGGCISPKRSSGCGRRDGVIHRWLGGRVERVRPSREHSGGRKGRRGLGIR